MNKGAVGRTDGSGQRWPLAAGERGGPGERDAAALGHGPAELLNLLSKERNFFCNDNFELQHDILLLQRIFKCLRFVKIS